MCNANRLVVTGEYGHLTADPHTGKVLSVEVDATSPFVTAAATGYHNITVFDVEELQRAYPGKQLTGGSIDILDVGFWSKDGSYEAPDAEWRDVMRRWGVQRKIEKPTELTVMTDNLTEHRVVLAHDA